MSAEKSLSDRADFGLIETFLWTRAEKFWLRELHRTRLQASAAALGFGFAPREFDALLDAFEAEAEMMRVRLELSPQGGLALTAAPFAPDDAEKIWRVAMAPRRVDSTDPLLRHKTTRREFYEKALAESGADEVIFLNQRDELTEGARTNIFVAGADGVLLTPPLASGLLPGVLRASLLAEGRAREAVLLREDLARGFWLGNSLRGFLRARLDEVSATAGAAAPEG